MAAFLIGPVSVVLNDSDTDFVGRPIGNRDGGPQEGSIRLARVTTPDGLISNIGLASWPDQTSDLRLVDFIAGPDAYRRLERAGNMTLNKVDAGLLAVLRALKFGARDYAKLESVGWEQLDSWCGGDARQKLQELGAVACGNHLELRAEAKNFRHDPAIVAPSADPGALFAGYALTRIIPLALDFGRASVEALH